MRATLAPPAPGTCACLVEIIELKWLLRGHGIHVHVERLQSDPEYARATLDAAAAMPNEALRRAAERLRSQLLPAP
jgi:predicted metal-dependent phosphoesterase TrpH